MNPLAWLNIGQAAKDLRQAVTGEKSEAVQLKEIEAQKEINVAQANTNTAEATSGKGSWRTHIGYTCAYSFRFYVIYTLLVFTFGNFGIDIYSYFKLGGNIPYLPEIDFSLPMNIMSALLGAGFAVLKTIEKAKGLRK